MVGGAPPATRRFCALAAAALSENADVVVAGSPVGELSLSSLIAQISGRPDFDGQDDSVLELGSNRLAKAGRTTVLLLQPPLGISRSALRYVQHMSRQAQGLILVVLASPALDALLEDPGFETLRGRLRAAPAIEASLSEPALGAGRAALPAPVARAACPVAIPARPASAPHWRALLWTASALGAVAATAMAAWIGHNATMANPTGERGRDVTMRIEPAVTPPPPLAQSQPPARAIAVTLANTVAAAAPVAIAAAAPIGAPASPPRQAPRSLAEPAALPPPPPTVPELPPNTTFAAALPIPLSQPDRTAHLRRPEPRRTDAVRYWRGESARYASDQAYAAPPPPPIIRRELRRNESPYVGTYVADPSGMRIFTYDP